MEKRPHADWAQRAILHNGRERWCIHEKQSAPVPYNTWDVTREILPTCFCIEFTHGHWEVAGRQQTEQVSSSLTRPQWIRKEPDLKITSSTFSFLNICACCKELIFNYQRDRQRTELVRVIHLCFILFYFSSFYLRETDVDIILLWARESVGTVRAWKPYMTCVYGPPCLSSSSSD